MQMIVCGHFKLFDIKFYLRGVQAFQFRKHDFDLWVRGVGLGMYQQLERGFGSMRAILPM